MADLQTARLPGRRALAHSTRPSVRCRRGRALMGEQPSLARKTAAVAGERPVTADHAVTRDDDGDRISGIRGPDGAHRGRATDRLRHRGIGDRSAGGYAAQGDPYGLLE